MYTWVLVYFVNNRTYPDAKLLLQSSLSPTCTTSTIFVPICSFKKLLEDYHSMITSVDKFLYKDEDKNNFKIAFTENKKRYNNLVKKVSGKNDEIRKKGKELVLSNTKKGNELKKHREYLNEQINEIKQKEEEEKRKKQDQDNERMMKQKQNSEQVLKQTQADEQEGNINKKKIGDHQNNTAPDLETRTIAKVNKCMEEKGVRKRKRETELEIEADKGDKALLCRYYIQSGNIKMLLYEFIHISTHECNLPLTRSKLNELKSMGEISREDLIDFIKTIIIDEEEAFHNMVTFFEIWDVQKTGFMHKDLILSILKQFGDNLTDEEADYLEQELNLSKESNVSYVNLLKTLIYGKE
ncbi:myosin light chain B, putative (MLC-B) [Plasmodium malariae]|uniref:Myosin light chain B, putative (MLC-B) n=1 Tax=Plasmodium malariae TaxID=5858 RepID=A0A1A8WX09_PLAMA|nr:myosin light chain B, putative (MLC-B) [Plasmodium malariae]